MKLNQYLVENAISQKEFAARLGVCQATVHKYLYKSTVPRMMRMMEIHKMTKGAVTFQDWLEMHESDSHG